MRVHGVLKQRSGIFLTRSIIICGLTLVFKTTNKLFVKTKQHAIPRSNRTQKLVVHSRGDRILCKTDTVCYAAN